MHESGGSHGFYPRRAYRRVPPRGPVRTAWQASQPADPRAFWLVTGWRDGKLACLDLVKQALDGRGDLASALAQALRVLGERAVVIDARTLQDRTKVAKLLPQPGHGRGRQVPIENPLARLPAVEFRMVM